MQRLASKFFLSDSLTLESGWRYEKNGFGFRGGDDGRSKRGSGVGAPVTRGP